MMTYARESKAGDRNYNEDCVMVTENDGHLCAVLADGLGAHGGGDLASRIVAEESVRIAGEAAVYTEDTMCSCFEQAQEKLMAEQEQLGQRYGMKTTMTLLLADEKQILQGHIGDSRIYTFKNGLMTGRTLDHSVPQALVRIGEITEDQIRHHPDRNRLLRVMGVDWEDEKPYVLAPAMTRQEDQAFLLCTDGFWEYILEAQMEACLQKTTTAEEWLDEMLKIVEKEGKGHNMDNYSAITIRMDE